VRATDPATFVAVVVVLLATAFVASWLPARRALRIDPVQALRSD
jgi:putative ABC transport system permease protein